MAKNTSRKTTIPSSDESEETKAQLGQLKTRMTLIENSKSFLVEAVGKALHSENDPDHWKFAIIHLVQALELVLKARIALLHPRLILSDIDGSNDRAKTVSLERALQRAQAFGLTVFDDRELKRIKKAISWRHQIIHHEFDFSVHEAKSIFGAILGILSDLFHVTASMELGQILPKKLAREALGIEQYWKRLHEKGVQRIQKQRIPKHRRGVCDRCGSWAFVSKDGNGTCYVCGYESPLVACVECKRLIGPGDGEEVSLDAERSKVGVVCWKCWDDHLSEMHTCNWFEVEGSQGWRTL